MFTIRVVSLLALVGSAQMCGLANPDTNRYFMLKNVVTGKCVDVQGHPGTAQRAQIQVYTCEFGDSSTDQVWKRDGNGRMVNRASHKCMDVQGYRNTDLTTNIQLYTCEDPHSSSTDQIWDFYNGCTTDYTQAQYVQLRNRYTNRCLDVAGYADPADSVNIQQFICEGLDNDDTDQWWQIIYV